MTEEQFEPENFVKLTDRELIILSEGRMPYIMHPTKGLVGADMHNAYVGIIELTEEEKLKLG